jgi:hypothetical protein
VARSRNHFAVETQQCSLCVVVDLHVTANYIQILSIAQQCFCCEFISPATMQITRKSFGKNCITTNVHSLHTLHIKAALKQKNVHLPMVSLDAQFGQTDRNDI